MPPWKAPQADPFTATRARSDVRRGAALLSAHPATCDAVAELLGCDAGWEEAGAPAAPSGVALLTAYPATCDAVAELLGCATV